MEEFKDINLEEELKKLEEELSVEDTLMGRLAKPSLETTADYWKKRVEEEKLLWQKILETKEEEKKHQEAKLKATEQELLSLKEQFNKLQETLQIETKALQEKLIVKETELAVEKERIEFIDRIKELEKENKFLQEQLSKLKEQHEIDKNQLEIAHRKDLEELLKTQETLIENLEGIETELKQLESESVQQKEKISSQEEKIQQLNIERQQLSDELSQLQALIEYKIHEAVKYEEQLFEHFSSVTEFFSNIIKDLLGTITGIINYCFKKLKLGFLSKNAPLKRQLLVAENIINEILQSIEKLTNYTKRQILNLQEISIEKLFNKLSDEIDTSSLPQGLKVKIDVAKFVSALRNYCEHAASFATVYNSTGKVVELKITIFSKIKFDLEFIQLKYVAALHRVIVVLNVYEDKSVILVSIPV